MANRKNQKLANVLVDELSPCVAMIRTTYIKDPQNETKHTGTGLMLKSPTGERYCLTANHVVSPIDGSPPKRRNILNSSHATVLDRSSTGEAIHFRTNYFRSKRFDLALLESRSSLTELYAEIAEGYLDTSLLTNLVRIDVPLHDEDLFFTIGYPRVGVREHVFDKHSIYEPFVYFFKLKGNVEETATHPDFYYLSYDVDMPPDGMSGAPVWLLRSTNSPTEPLPLSQMDESQIETHEYAYTFAGTIIELYPDKRRLFVVKPQTCARFVSHFEPRMPSIRDAKESTGITNHAEFLTNGGYSDLD